MWGMKAYSIISGMRTKQYLALDEWGEASKLGDK